MNDAPELRAYREMINHCCTFIPFDIGQPRLLLRCEFCGKIRIPEPEDNHLS